MLVPDMLIDGYRPIRTAVFAEVSSKDIAIRIDTRLRSLLTAGIQNVDIRCREDTGRHFQVTVELTNGQDIVFDGAELYIPRIVKFSIDRRGITFSENEPYAILSRAGETYGQALSIRE